MIMFTINICTTSLCGFFIRNRIEDVALACVKTKFFISKFLFVFY